MTELTPPKKYLLPVLFQVYLFGLLPLIYNPHLADPELTVRFLVFIPFLLTISGIFLFSKRIVIPIHFKSIKQNKLTAVTLLFIGVAAVSIIHSNDTAAGLYDFLRFVLMVQFFFFTYLLLINKIVEKEDFYIGSAVAVALLFILSLKDILPALMVANHKGKHFRVEYWFGSTCGNKDFYAEALFMFLPFLISGIVSLTNWRKSLCVFSFMLALTSVIILQCTTVVLVLFLLTIVVLVLMFYFKLTPGQSLTNKKNKSTPVVISLFALTILLAFIYFTNFATIKSKFTSLSGFIAEKNIPGHIRTSYGSISERILLWRNTVRIIKDYPLFGCGLANWKTLLPSYGNFEMAFMDSGNLRPEHPHNDYLMIFCELGLVGLLLYLLAFFFILKKAYNNFKRSKEKKETIIGLMMLCGIIGFMLLSVTGFPKERFFPILMLMVIFSIVCAENSPINPVPKPFIRKSLARWFLFFILALNIFSFYFFAARYIGEIRLANGITYQTRKDWSEMQNELLRAKSFAFTSDRLAVPLDWYAGFASYYAHDFISAERYFHATVKRNPYFIQGWNDLGTCYNQRGDYAEAINCYQTVIKINPEYKGSLLNMSAAYYNSGQLEKAYQTICECPVNGSDQQYMTYLTTILRAKFHKDLGVNINPLLVDKLQKTAKNNKSLLKLFLSSQSSGKNIDTLFMHSIDK